MQCEARDGQSVQPGGRVGELCEEESGDAAAHRYCEELWRGVADQASPATVLESVVAILLCVVVVMVVMLVANAQWRSRGRSA